MSNAEVTREYFQPPDPVVAAHCDECGGEIYKHEEAAYRIDGLHSRLVCADCIEEVTLNEFENMGFADRLEVVGGVIIDPAEL